MDVKKRKETQSAFLLVLTSVIWGVAFVFQRTGMEYIGPFAFNFFRCVISTIFLFLVSTVIGIKNRKSGVTRERLSKKSLMLGGVLAGFALFLAMSTQQVGMVSTTASKAGFITTMYIVIVPVLGIFYGRRATPKMWLCILIAAVGLYLLSIKEGFIIEKGDFLVFVSSIFFSLQIVIIDIFAPKVDAIKLSMVEFITTGILSMIVMLTRETVTMFAIKSAFVAIMYTGLLSSGVGFTLQIVVQKHLPPTLTSLIMSTESGISVIAGVLMLGESLTEREIVGCIIMVIAVLLAQIQLPTKVLTEKIAKKTFNI